MRLFRAAVEAADHDTIRTLLAEDVVFTSPVAFRPYQGRAVTAAILKHVSEVFQDFRYVSELSDESGTHHAFVFAARVGELAIDGCDFIRTNGEGRISEFTVMVRPLSAATALAQAMSSRFEQIEQDVMGA